MWSSLAGGHIIGSQPSSFALLSKKLYICIIFFIENSKNYLEVKKLYKKLQFLFNIELYTFFYLY